MVNLSGHQAPPRRPARTVDARRQKVDPERPIYSRSERIGRWVLRLMLPLMVGFAAQLIYWMWFDNPYGLGVGSVVGGLLIGITAVAAAFWAWHCWFSNDCF